MQRIRILKNVRARTTGGHRSYRAGDLVPAVEAAWLTEHDWEPEFGLWEQPPDPASAEEIAAVQSPDDENQEELDDGENSSPSDSP